MACDTCLLTSDYDQLLRGLLAVSPRLALSQKLLTVAGSCLQPKSYGHWFPLQLTLTHLMDFWVRNLEFISANTTGNPGILFCCCLPRPNQSSTPFQSLLPPLMFSSSSALASSLHHLLLLLPFLLGMPSAWAWVTSLPVWPWKGARGASLAERAVTPPGQKDAGNSWLGEGGARGKRRAVQVSVSLVARWHPRVEARYGESPLCVLS